VEMMVAAVPVVAGTQPAKPVASSPKNESEPESQGSLPKLPKAQLRPDEVKKTVDELNEAMQTVGTALSFSVDKETGRTVVKVLDSKTGEVIRQIPAEEMVRIQQRIAKLMGVLFDDEA
jgi:flagellar protein FlaG